MTTAIERDFETGDLRGTAPTVSQEQVGHGSYAMRVYNHRHNSPSPGRTEVRVNNDSGGRLEIPAAAGKVCYNVESHLNSGNTSYHPRPLTLEKLQKEFLMQIGCGIRGFMFWQLHAETIGLESPAWG
ncbi:hypothetical protein LCGC14_2537240, partial [marine sediment metagenome]